MNVKNNIVKIIAVLLVAPMMHAVSVHHLHSVIASPAHGSTVMVRGPVVSGIVNDTTGKPIRNKPVAVYVDARKVAVVPTNSDGVWSCLLSNVQSLQDGMHIVQAYVVLTPSNNVWTQAAKFDVQALRTSGMGLRSGNVSVANSAINFPFDGADINTTTPTIVGSLVDSNYNPVVGETVNVSINGVNLATVTSDSNGVFSYQVSTPLSDGTYTVGAHCVQSAVDLTTNSFTVDTTPPVAPTIVAPAANSTVNSSTVTVSGTTEANATITTFMDGDMFGDISYADAYGTWSITYTLANGSHSVTAQATDMANNTGSMSGITNFTVSA